MPAPERGEASAAGAILWALALGALITVALGVFADAAVAAGL